MFFFFENSVAQGAGIFSAHMSLQMRLLTETLVTLATHKRFHFWMNQAVPLQSRDFKKLFIALAAQELYLHWASVHVTFLMPPHVTRSEKWFVTYVTNERSPGFCVRPFVYSKRACVMEWLSTEEAKVGLFTSVDSAVIFQAPFVREPLVTYSAKKGLGFEVSFLVFFKWGFQKHVIAYIAWKFF